MTSAQKLDEGAVVRFLEEWFETLTEEEKDKAMFFIPAEVVQSCYTPNQVLQEIRGRTLLGKFWIRQLAQVARAEGILSARR